MDETRGSMTQLFKHKESEGSSFPSKSILGFAHPVDCSCTSDGPSAGSRELCKLRAECSTKKDRRMGNYCSIAIVWETKTFHPGEKITKTRSKRSNSFRKSLKLTKFTSSFLPQGHRREKTAECHSKINPATGRSRDQWSCLGEAQSI